MAEENTNGGALNTASNIASKVNDAKKVAAAVAKAASQSKGNIYAFAGAMAKEMIKDPALFLKVLKYALIAVLAPILIIVLVLIGFIMAIIQFITQLFYNIRAYHILHSGSNGDGLYDATLGSLSALASYIYDVSTGETGDKNEDYEAAIKSAESERDAQKSLWLKIDLTTNLIKTRYAQVQRNGLGGDQVFRMLLDVALKINSDASTSGLALVPDTAFFEHLTYVVPDVKDQDAVMLLCLYSVLYDTTYNDIDIMHYRSWLGEFYSTTHVLNSIIEIFTFGLVDSQLDESSTKYYIENNFMSDDQKAALDGVATYDDVPLDVHATTSQYVISLDGEYTIQAERWHGIFEPQYKIDERAQTIEILEKMSDTYGRDTTQWPDEGIADTFWDGLGASASRSVDPSIPPMTPLGYTVKAIGAMFSDDESIMNYVGSVTSAYAIVSETTIPIVTIEDAEAAYQAYLEQYDALEAVFGAESSAAFISQLKMGFLDSAKWEFLHASIDRYRASYTAWLNRHQSDDEETIEEAANPDETQDEEKSQQEDEPPVYESPYPSYTTFDYYVTVTLAPCDPMHLANVAGLWDGPKENVDENGYNIGRNTPYPERVKYEWENNGVIYHRMRFDQVKLLDDMCACACAELGLEYTTIDRTGDGGADIVSVALAEYDAWGDNTAYAAQAQRHYWEEYNAVSGTDPFSYSEPWCCCFVYVCAYYCGYVGSDPECCFGNYMQASCDYSIKAFKELGVYHDEGSYVPVPGDILYFHKTTGNGAHHIGIVVEVDGTQIKVAEGNSGNRLRINTYTDYHVGSILYGNSVVYGYAAPNYPAGQSTDLTVFKSVNFDAKTRNISSDPDRPEYLWGRVNATAAMLEEMKPIFDEANFKAKYGDYTTLFENEIGSDEFNAAWDGYATTGKFQEGVEEAYRRTVVTPFVQSVRSATGVNMSAVNKVLQELCWCIVTRYGPEKGVNTLSLAGINSDMSTKEVIDAYYNYALAHSSGTENASLVREQLAMTTRLDAEGSNS